MNCTNPSTRREIFRILEDAIRDEDRAHDQYEEAARHTEDPCVRKVLLDLAAMEHQHHVLLENTLNELRAVTELQDEINEAYG
jgi:rubrerythrin